MTETEKIFSGMDRMEALSSGEKHNIDLDLLKEWISELRNPENKQARSFLARKRKKSGGGVGRCCLGLLCHVANMEVRPATGLDTHYFDVDAYAFMTEFEEYWTTPPTELQHRVGIQYIIDPLVELNDNARQPYTVIANYIEEYMRRNGVL